MKSYYYRWKVVIKKGLWMAGTHRFFRKHDAEEFVGAWKRTTGNAPSSYADLPTVESEKRRVKSTDFPI